MFGLVIDSFLKPRETIATVLRWGYDEAALIRIAALISVALGILQGVGTFANAPADDGAVLQSPFFIAGFQFAETLIMAVAVHQIGKALGGRADFRAALTVSVWFLLVSLLPGVIFTVLQVAATGLIPIFVLVLGIWMIGMFSIFVQEIHGFESLFLTVLGVVGTGFLFGMVFLMILSGAGVVPETL